MRVSSIGINNSISVKNNKKVQNNPSFGRTQYAQWFGKFFDGACKYHSNSSTYETLMLRALDTKGAIVDKFVNTHFKPYYYYDMMSSFRQKKPIYKTISDNCYESPTWLIKNGNDVLVSVVSFNDHGNFLDLLFGETVPDTRICFHGINEYKDHVICLGCDKDGKHFRSITRNGIGTLIAGEIGKNL